MKSFVFVAALTAMMLSHAGPVGAAMGMTRHVAGRVIGKGAKPGVKAVNAFGDDAVAAAARQGPKSAVVVGGKSYGNVMQRLTAASTVPARTIGADCRVNDFGGLVNAKTIAASSLPVVGVGAAVGAARVADGASVNLRAVPEAVAESERKLTDCSIRVMSDPNACDADKELARTHIGNTHKAVEASVQGGAYKVFAHYLGVAVVSATAILSLLWMRRRKKGNTPPNSCHLWCNGH